MDDTDGNLHVFTFAETPKMSTYLVAFVVSQFDKKEMTSAKNTKVRVWARPGAIDPKDTVDYSLKVRIRGEGERLDAECGYWREEP